MRDKGKVKKRQRGGGCRERAGKTQAERANGEQMPKIRSGIVRAPSDGEVVNSAAGSPRKEPHIYPHKKGTGQRRGDGLRHFYVKPQLPPFSQTGPYVTSGRAHMLPPTAW